MSGDLRWCSCGWRLIDPQEFRQRGSNDPDLFCARCRTDINDEFEVESV